VRSRAEVWAQEFLCLVEHCAVAVRVMAEGETEQVVEDLDGDEARTRWAIRPRMSSTWTSVLRALHRALSKIGIAGDALHFDIVSGADHDAIGRRQVHSLCWLTEKLSKAEQ
jgi:hypothetical protein